MVLRAIILASLIGLSACSTIQRIPGIPGGRDDESSRLETLMGTRIIENDILVVRVASNGCTQKADFAVDVRRRGSAYDVTIERTREDYCRAIIADGVEIPWGFEELGVRPGREVRVVNPVSGG